MNFSRSGFPSIEVTQMSISQSVECPLTTKDTVILAGNLANNNGRGSGHVTVTGRRLTSHTSWIEVGILGSQVDILGSGRGRYMGQVEVSIYGSGRGR